MNRRTIPVIRVVKDGAGYHVQDGASSAGPFDSLRAAYVAAIAAKWSGGGYAIIRIDPAAVGFQGVSGEHPPFGGLGAKATGGTRAAQASRGSPTLGDAAMGMAQQLYVSRRTDGWHVVTPVHRAVSPSHHRNMLSRSAITRPGGLGGSLG